MTARTTVIMTGLAILAMAFSGCTTQETAGLTLKLGTMMPLTGGLSNLGQDMQNGAKLAIDEINAAGAGIRIEAFHEDDKTTDTAAGPNTFNLLASKGVTAIAGPCCSGVTGSILDLAKDNQVVIASPSATSPALTLERDNDGYFWRVPPSDAVQGKVLAGLVAENNVTTASVILINNPYGNGLANVFKQAFEARVPPGAVLKMEKFPEDGATSFSSQVDAVCATPRPQAIVIVAYTKEGGAIVKELQAKGCLADVKLFGSEGVYSVGGKISHEAGNNTQGTYLTVGMKGTTPESGDLSRYNAKFKAKYGADPDLYSAESYDAVMFLALAALKAGSTDGDAIKEELLSIANGGTKVSDFKEAAQMIKDGKDIDWVGQAHDFDYDDRHEPKTGIYSYWEIMADGKPKITATGKSA